MRDGRCGRTAPFDLCARWGMAAMRPTCPRWALFRVVERSSRCYVDRNATARGAYGASDRGSRWILIITLCSSGHNWQIQKLPPRLAPTDGRVSALILEKGGVCMKNRGRFGRIAGVATSLMLRIAYISAIFVQMNRGSSKKDSGLWIASPRAASRLPGYTFRRRAARRAMALRGCLSVQAQRVPGRQGTGRAVCPAASCRGGFGARYTGSYLVKCDI